MLPMPRCWAYAILTIALACGAVQRHTEIRIGGESSITEATAPVPAAARKRTGSQPSTVKAASGHLLALAPAAIELANERTWIVETIVVVERRAARAIASANARAPPV
jgi:hypothetical protein